MARIVGNKPVFTLESVVSTTTDINVEDHVTDAISKGLPQNKPPVIDPDIALILAMYEASE